MDVSSEKPLISAGKRIAPDHVIVQLLKRLYSIAPLIAMSVSTISQIFDAAKNISSQSSSQSYNRFVEVISNNQHSYFTCQYGVADAVVVYCPVDSLAAFQACLILWVIYFAAYMILRLYVTSSFSTHDLRFYIAIDRFNAHIVNKCWVAFGFLLTLATMGVGLYYLSPQSAWNKVIDSSSLTSIIVFFGINVVALRNLLITTTKVPYDRTHTTCSGDYSMMGDFPSPLFLNCDAIVATNGHLGRRVLGIFHSVDRIFQPLILGYMKYLEMAHTASKYGDTVEDTVAESYLGEFGDAVLLAEAMRKLYLLK